jgi:hypothetical protein
MAILHLRLAIARFMGAVNAANFSLRRSLFFFARFSAILPVHCRQQDSMITRSTKVRAPPSTVLMFRSKKSRKMLHRVYV